ncbi:MAG: hypothetical protein KJP09_06725 [Bacteroidia bacterium]|nr:hypothetical protein [Bacteroidia bacterium]MBT8309513.1 hypothetical protein [Bacteroidia bacterium]NNK26782.1 leucine-rich repeat domain-containing protein [Flavobacteriaceae bacterium]NNL60845.1 leucine-rich repeat domain-containing protein [Flavobacteriaceae bacterium]
MTIKHSSLAFLLIFLMGTTLFAQRAKSESTSSIYFSIPAYDLSTNTDQFRYAFAMGQTEFEKPETIEVEEVCVAASSKNVLKDAKKITVYQYRVPAEINDAYLIVENASGDILHAEEYTSYQRTGSLVNETVNRIFGADKCYWHPSVLEEAWKDDNYLWKNEQHQNLKDIFLNRAKQSAEAAMKAGYTSYSVNVYTGKGGKGHDYSALDQAQNQALAAYNNMRQNGKVTDQDINQLKQPMNTWLTHLETVNLNDKNAKINRKVAQGLYMNLATAYFQSRNFDEASKFLELYEDAYSNAISRGSNQGVKNLSNMIVNQRKGLAVNTNISNDYVALNSISMPSNFNVNIEDLGEEMASELGARYHFHSKDKEKEANIAASGSIYKSNINQGQYGPTLVMMTVYDGDLDEFPLEVTELDVKGMVFTGGYSFTSLPPDIGNMTNLEQIILMDSQVASIPKEIGKLTNLKRFNLNRTKISTLPESIKNLKNLKMLNIKNTNVSAAEAAKIKSWLPKGCKLKL